MDFYPRGKKFIKNIDDVFEVLYNYSDSSDKLMIKDDINLFKANGRFAIHNTFSGGIHLKEPETIKSISIDFSTKTNSALVKVRYSSNKRSKINTKYSDISGQLVSFEWNMRGILPNFYNYSENSQLIIIAFIGKYVKKVCEFYNKNSLYMNYLKDFDLFLSVNNVSRFKFIVNSVLDNKIR